MAILLGLAVAAAYGAADFLGGLTSRRSAVLAVIASSQVVGVTALAVVVLLTPTAHPTARDLLLGSAVGVTGSFAVACLYRGLSIGRMSVVAPITAVGSAVLPVAWGVLQGERPTVVTGVGVVLAVTAVMLVAGSHGERSAVSPRLELSLAVGAGLGFGTGFILLAETGEDAGLWPVLMSRPTSIALVVTFALLTSRPLVPERPDRPMVALSGVLDVAANACFLLATRAGLLSVVAPLAALYPATTVLLARVVLSERLTRHQTVGLVAGAAGVVLIAAG